MGNAVLVAATTIYDIGQRHASFVLPDDLREIAHAGIDVADRRDVGRDVAIVEGPEWACRRQRLDLEDIEARGTQRAVGEGTHDVGLALMPAPRRIDDNRDPALVTSLYFPDDAARTSDPMFNPALVVKPVAASITSITKVVP